MTKFTKRQYLAEVAANHMSAADLRIELESYQNRLEAGEPIDTLSDAWNAAYDRQYELDQERADIERRWSRRGWTGADHATHDLIAANVD
jgi:hypothetical protein